jgi:hypothetical protein
LAPFDKKWQVAIRRFSFLGVSAKDNSKQWAMRRLSQLLVLTLLSSSILLYQFLQRAIGGRGQFLKASCHSWGFDSAALKGILWDSAEMNSDGNKMVIGPQRESRFRRLEPIKNKKGQEEKSEMKFEKVIPNGP